MNLNNRLFYHGMDGRRFGEKDMSGGQKGAELRLVTPGEACLLYTSPSPRDT